ncbi:hypothetical protein [Helicobacter rodentium]|nr:hypothetical protein [Helicobacter rodentium]
MTRWQHFLYARLQIASLAFVRTEEQGKNGNIPLYFYTLQNLEIETA